MFKFIARRLTSTVIVITLVSMSVFLIFAFLPMDPARLTCGKGCSVPVIEANRHRLGLDVPVQVQYGRFVKGLFVGREYGDGAAKIECAAPAFGYSFTRHECVTTLIASAFPVTFSLAIGAFVLWLLLGVSLGVLAARRQGRWQDKASTVFVLVGISLPTFISGILIYLMALRLGLINPIEAGRWVSPFTNPIGWVKNFYLPWIVLALAFAATYTRFTRSNVIETSSEDYIRTARAKGLSEKVILRKHTLRAALAPIVTIAGLDFAGLLGGAIITEQIFNLPGLGRLSLRAVLIDYDLPVIVSTTILAATFVVIMNLVVDILYAYIDPRVRVG
ncbi:MAG: ABC transporter permease [Candidatus Nanopelagicaceae bacterium]|nr:ABC transporter permease [Candidatus Nanopelagicaceae bacterium]